MSRDEVKGREHVVARQKALTAVFKRFAAVWPRAFAASQWDVIMETWLDNLGHVDTRVLEDAARQFLSTAASQYPPKPWEFAKFARQYATRHAGPELSLPLTVSRRVWEWVSPFNRRICRVEEFGDGFACSNLDDHWAFEKLTRAGKIEHCEKMVTDHADFLRRTA